MRHDVKFLPHRSILTQSLTRLIICVFASAISFRSKINFLMNRTSDQIRARIHLIYSLLIACCAATPRNHHENEKVFDLRLYRRNHHLMLMFTQIECQINLFFRSWIHAFVCVLYTNTHNTLRCNAFWITRKHGHFSYVVEAKIKHNDPFHADSSAGVGRATVSERVNVGLDLFEI